MDDVIAALFDTQFPGRLFEMYSITTKEALSSPASFSNTYDELEQLEMSGHATNGVSVREVL